MCGFRWDSITADELPQRLRLATDAFCEVIRAAGPRAGQRPEPQRWSILEYGAHLRDVLISVRERMISASVTDEPLGAALHREERVTLGFYALDTPDVTARELEVVSGLFTRTFRALPDGFEQRRFTFSAVSPKVVTIMWAGAQALHECEHHLSDVRENLARLA